MDSTFNLLPANGTKCNKYSHKSFFLLFFSSFCPVPVLLLHNRLQWPAARNALHRSFLKYKYHIAIREDFAARTRRRTSEGRTSGINIVTHHWSLLFIKQSRSDATFGHVLLPNINTHEAVFAFLSGARLPSSCAPPSRGSQMKLPRRRRRRSDEVD